MKTPGRILAGAFLLFTIFFHGAVTQVSAQSNVLGIHILNPSELTQAQALLQPQGPSDEWSYVTIPLTLNDLDRHDERQKFFDEAKVMHFVPIVRLATEVSGNDGTWATPTRYQIVELISFLTQLQWPTTQQYVIVFNEVNHAQEWGGTLDPASYADTLAFTSSSAHAADPNFVVLPAAMDLAAPNSSTTMEAFNYLNKMQAENSDIFSYVDKWNSHSYPNPGFSAAPTKVGQNSLRGFEVELKYLKQKTGKDYQVLITETSWVANKQTSKWLASYYTYAMQHIWSNPQVIAVTPFLLQGDPGPFAGFTFLDKNNKPTAEYQALQKAMLKMQGNT